MKEPKRYECLNCGFVSKRCKTYHPHPSFGFAVCFKCRGRVKEREEWLDWYQKQRELYRNSLIR